MRTAILALVLAAAAGSPLDRLPGDKAGEVIRRAIDYHGGMEKWSAMRSVSFKKTTTRYRPDGTVESARTAVHQYLLHPSPKMRITWDDAGKKVVLVNDGQQAWKTVGGVPATTVDDVNGARNSTFGSHYVFGIPFKLTDQGLHLEHVGTEKLAGGTSVDKIRVTYDKGAGDAGGYHTWTYYFDTKTGRLVANLLLYEPNKYDYTEYHDEILVDGIRVATRRPSHPADARGKTGKRATEVRYEAVRFNEPLGKALFVK